MLARLELILDNEQIDYRHPRPCSSGVLRSSPQYALRRCDTAAHRNGFPFRPPERAGCRGLGSCLNHTHTF